MKKLLKKYGFTLVELIVVVVILAVLASLAFMTVSKWIGASKDTRRKADLSIVENGMNMYMMSSTIYPDPDNMVVVKDSLGGTGWYQGELGDTVKDFISGLKKTPKDPSGENYGYSITTDKKKYQLRAITENQEKIGYIGDNLYAATYYGYIKGNYEGYVIILTGGTYNLYQIPSLFVNDIDLSAYRITTGLQPIIQNNKAITDKFDVKKVDVSTMFDGNDDNNGTILTDIVKAMSGNDEILKKETTAYRIVKQAPGTNPTTLSATPPAIEGGSSSSSVSGECGASNNTTVGTIPTVNLCSLGTTGSVTTYSTGWTWSCVGTNGGTTANCSAIKTPDPINGTCGTSNGQTLTTIPTANLCSAGTTGSVTTNTSTYTWNCAGVNAGTTANCTATRVIITQSNCTDAGWEWIPSAQDMTIGTTNGNGFCISPTIDFGDTLDGLGGISFNGWGNNTTVYYNGWNTESYVGNRDSGNTNYTLGQTRTLSSPSGYTCKSIGTATKGYRNSSGTDNVNGEDTLVNRMRYLQNYKNTHAKVLSSAIDWVDFGAIIPVNSHAIPAIFLSDCLDGVKDLGTDMSYKHTDDNIQTITYAQYSTDASDVSTNLSNAIYQNRQKYLLGRTQKSGSHLPSAYSSIAAGSGGIGIGEYQKACSYNDGTVGTIAGTNDQTSGEWIWSASIGDTDGSSWSINIRLMGYSGCSGQGNRNSSGRYDSGSSRLVVRP